MVSLSADTKITATVLKGFILKQATTLTKEGIAGKLHECTNNTPSSLAYVVYSR